MLSLWIENIIPAMIKRLFSGVLLAVLALQASAFHTDTISIETKYLDSPLDVTVIVPEAAVTNPSLRFPTVYLLNGYSGDHRAWGACQPRLGELADTYGMVMVMPDGRDSWYWNSTIDPGMQMESFFVADLVPYIDGHYPTVKDRTKRAITGLSMGGQGAFWLATHHPDIWGNIGSTSGGVDILPFKEKWKMAKRIGKYEDNPSLWKKHSIASLVPEIAAGRFNIIFDCGTDDFFAGVNQKLHESLLKAGVEHDYISRPGNHTQAYWRNAILYHLLFFNEAFNR